MACCLSWSSVLPLMVGLVVGGVLVVSGATCPGLYCRQAPPVREAQRTATPAPWFFGLLTPTVLTMTLLPLLPVWNQSAVMTLSGQVIAFSPRVARATTICLRHCGAAVATTQTALLPLRS